MSLYVGPIVRVDAMGKVMTAFMHLLEVVFSVMPAPELSYL